MEADVRMFIFKVHKLIDLALFAIAGYQIGKWIGLEIMLGLGG